MVYNSVVQTFLIPYTTKILPRENFRQFRQWTSMAKIFSSNIFSHCEFRHVEFFVRVQLLEILTRVPELAC